MEKFFILILIILLAFCAPQKKVDLTPQISEYQNKIEEADSLFKRGSYSCLKDAFRLYQELLSFSFEKKITQEKLIRTALLLALREKELGILDGPYQKKAVELSKELFISSEFSLYLDIVNSISAQTKGVARDTVEEAIEKTRVFRKIQESKDLMTQLKEQAKTEEFLAYLYLAMNCHYYYVRSDIKEDFSSFLEIHSASPSIKFKYATCIGENQELLKEIIQIEPCFQEVYFFLGEIALKHRQLISAEKNFLKAHQEFPDSLSILISLANIHLAFEEVEKSLEYYENTLILAPEHRDALLGKAICLSYLGKHEEAIEVLHTLLSLGKWYLGETYYWLAWNQHELRNIEKAWEYVEKAKNYLPTSSEVFCLSGIIGFEQNRLKEAEKDFREAIKFGRSNCEAIFYLGRVYSEEDDWKNSGLSFESAAHCHEGQEKAIEEKIVEVKASSLSEERKAKLILRKEVQLRKTILTRATAFYNAAAGFFNSEMREKALICAQKASRHPSFRQKAEELIERIRRKQ